MTSRISYGFEKQFVGGEPCPENRFLDLKQEKIILFDHTEDHPKPFYNFSLGVQIRSSTLMTNFSQFICLSLD
jgi:hypothetical protein